jgi:putative ABC transport system substrate-binding protein
LKRREFITLLGVAGLWPTASRAQRQTTPVIGFVSSRNPGESADIVTAFREGLGEAGFSEGQNVAIAFRWAEGHYDRLPALAAELVDLRANVILAAGGPPSALAAKRATSDIPIVFAAVSEPVRLGLVAGLNRPGGNVTGMSFLDAELITKTTQLLKETLPAATIFALLTNPSGPNTDIYIKQASLMASTLGIEFPVLKASTERELDEAFASLATLKPGGLVVPAEPFFDSHREKIASLAAQHAIPMIANLREYVVAGALMSYGPSLPDLYRQAGVYVGRILKGEKPADLPVQQPTRFNLVINAKAAKALGLKFSDRMLALADEVID